MRSEVLIIFVFVERIAPKVVFVAYLLWHTRVCPEDVEQAFGVVLVKFGNRVALFVGGFGIVPAVANHIGGEGTVIVVVCLVGIPGVGTR